MKLDKAARREAQQHKAKHGMRVSSRSLKTVLLPLLAKRAKEATR